MFLMFTFAALRMVRVVSQDMRRSVECGRRGKLAQLTYSDA